MGIQEELRTQHEGLNSLVFVCPCSSGGGAGGQAAKDALGNDVKVDAWLKTHNAGDRSLTQGLKVRRNPA
jgi:hypothetical protein